jgi:hypothetical protein
MPTLELTPEQVIQLVKQLPPEQKRAVLLLLVTEAGVGRNERMEHAEAQLRRQSAERGLDWHSLSDDERLAFVDDLVHEEGKLSRRCHR